MLGIFPDFLRKRRAFLAEVDYKWHTRLHGRNEPSASRLEAFTKSTPTTTLAGQRPQVHHYGTTLAKCVADSVCFGEPLGQQ